RGRHAPPDRRGADPGLVPILAAGELRPRPAAAFAGQAAGSGLPRFPRRRGTLEPRATGAAAAAGGRRRDVATLPGSISAPDGVPPGRIPGSGPGACTPNDGTQDRYVTTPMRRRARGEQDTGGRT